MSQEFTWNIDLNSWEYSDSLGLVLFELHKLTEDAQSFGVPARTPERVRKYFLDEIQLVKAQLGLSSKLETQWRAWVDEDTY